MLKNAVSARFFWCGFADFFTVLITRFRTTCGNLPTSFSQRPSCICLQGIPTFFSYSVAVFSVLQPAEFWINHHQCLLLLRKNNASELKTTRLLNCTLSTIYFLHPTSDVFLFLRNIFRFYFFHNGALCMRVWMWWDWIPVLTHF